MWDGRGERGLCLGDDDELGPEAVHFPSDPYSVSIIQSRLHVTSHPAGKCQWTSPGSTASSIRPLIKESALMCVTCLPPSGLTRSVHGHVHGDYLGTFPLDGVVSFQGGASVREFQAQWKRTLDGSFVVFCFGGKGSPLIFVILLSLQDSVPFCCFSHLDPTAKGPSPSLFSSPEALHYEDHPTPH